MTIHIKFSKKGIVVHLSENLPLKSREEQYGGPIYTAGSTVETAAKACVVRGKTELKITSITRLTHWKNPQWLLKD